MSATEMDVPRIDPGGSLRPREVIAIWGQMREKGLSIEADQLARHLDSIEQGATLHRLLNQLVRHLTLNSERTTALEEQVKSSNETASRAAAALERLAKAEEARLEMQRSAEEAESVLKQTVAEQEAKTERFRIQNRRLTVGIVVTSLGGASGLGALVLALIERLA